MTDIHAFDADGTASPGAQTALNNATDGLATETYVDGAVDAIPNATTGTAGLMSPADQVRLAAPGIYAADYGATGDGITDDSAALTAACAAAEGKVLHLTAGAVYSIRSKVVLSDGITVEGHGATIAKPTDPADNLSLVKGTPAGKQGYGSGGRNITIRDLTIRGNYSAESGYGDCSSSFHHVSGLTFENCTFSQGVIDGHYIDLAACDNVRVIGCDFEGSNPRGGREYIEAIQLDSSYYVGLSDKSEPLDTLDGLPTKNVKVAFCDFRTLTVGGIEYPTSNPIGNHSVVLAGDEGALSDITFVENTVTGWMRDTTSFYAGWVCFVGVRNARVSGNTFTYTGEAEAMSRGVVSLKLADEAVPIDQVRETSTTKVAINRHCADILIEGNTFNGFGEYFNAPSGNALIQVSDGGVPSGIRIIGNRLRACNGESVRLRGDPITPIVIEGNIMEAPVVSYSTHMTLTNNIIGSDATKNRAGNAVFFYATPNAIVKIAGNTVTGYENGIVVEAAEAGVVQGNCVRHYVGNGITIGKTSGARPFGIIVSGNRLWSSLRTSSTNALAYLATSVNTVTYGNSCRDGGSILDQGSGTIKSANDQTT